MKPWRLKKWTFCVLLACQSLTFAGPPAAWAYVGWWLPDSWRSAPLEQLDRILFFQLKIGADGSISERNGWPEAWADLSAAMLLNGKPLDLTLTLLDEATFDKVFSANDAVAKLLADALALGGGTGVAGLQLDVEVYTAVRPELILRYRSFVVELSKRLREQSPPRTLSVFFPMGGVSQLYDPPTLAQVDHLVLQGYDSHWLESKVAGPVAPLFGDEAVTWEKAVKQAQLLGVSADRLFLGFPLYGYEWPVKKDKPRSPTSGKGSYTTFVPMPEAMRAEFPISVQQRGRQFGANHDPISGSSFYHYKKAKGEWVQGWYEDWWSLDRKIDYLKAQQLGGIAFFMLGYDDNQLVNFFLSRRNSNRNGVELAPTIAIPK